MAAGRILIVDADQKSVDNLRIAFEPEEYELLVATSGKEAWNICRRHMPHAILLNVNLPDMDGYELLRRIRNALRTRHVHVTFLTERKERRDKIAGLEMGADDYILKPYDPEELRLRIRNVLQRVQAGNLVDPASGLPGSRLIQQQLLELLRRQDNWALMRVAVRNLDEFADAHGFLAGKNILSTIARALSEAVDEHDGHNDFIGHSGGDEFIVITSAQAAEKLGPNLTRHLQAISHAHYTPREREQGFVLIPKTGEHQRQAPLIKIVVAKVTAADGPFHDIMQLTSALD